MQQITLVAMAKGLARSVASFCRVFFIAKIVLKTNETTIST